MSKPRVAIPVPTSFDQEYNRQCWPQYAEAVEQAGGLPVRVELNLKSNEIVRLANTCSGILLPGSPADVSPQKYGHQPDPATSAADVQRENVDELLLQDAFNLHKPIFGICYGAQSLNVWRGGTLVQDLGVLPVNHSAGSSVAIAHSVSVVTDSEIGASARTVGELDAGQRVPINSSHHQAIGVVGDGLRVVARCPQDAVIEAVEGMARGHYVLGVQWHPERSPGLSKTSQELFRRFVERCAVWTPRRVEVSVVA